MYQCKKNANDHNAFIIANRFGSSQRLDKIKIPFDANFDRIRISIFYQAPSWDWQNHQTPNGMFTQNHSQISAKKVCRHLFPAIVDINSNLTPNLYQYMLRNETRIGFYRMISPYSASGTHPPREVKSNRVSLSTRNCMNARAFDASPIAFREIVQPSSFVGCRPQLETEREEYRAYFKSIIFKLLNCRCDTQFSAFIVVIRHASQFSPYGECHFISRPFGMQLA